MSILIWLPAEGEILQGTVLKVTSKDVIVDFGYKSEGLVPIEQFLSPSGEMHVKAGDVVDVMIDHGEQPEGYILLSHAQAARLRVWDNLEKAYRGSIGHLRPRAGTRQGRAFRGCRRRGFMPGSQVDPRPVHHLDSFIGQDIPVKIIKLNRRRGNVVVSRKTGGRGGSERAQDRHAGSSAEGAVVTGMVKNLTEYGAFVDLGGIDGLLHVTDMSYGRVAHPSEVVHVGDNHSQGAEVRPREGTRFAGHEADGARSVGDRRRALSGNGRVVGQVVNVTDYGAFVELEPGVEGLIHITEMTWSRRMKHPSKVVKPGDQVEAVVLEVNPRDRRISLGMKQLEANPWTTIDSRYSIGSVVEGRVRNMTDFGAFIEIEEGIDGLVHVSDLSWTKRVKHPSEVLKKGQIVQAVILNIDAQGHRLSLGIKQLQPDAWETLLPEPSARATSCMGGCRGWPASAPSWNWPRASKGCAIFRKCRATPDGARRSRPLAVGQEYDFKIVKMSEAEKKIGLSLKAVADDEEKGRLAVINGRRRRAPRPSKKC